MFFVFSVVCTVLPVLIVSRCFFLFCFVLPCFVCFPSLSSHCLTLCFVLCLPCVTPGLRCCVLAFFSWLFFVCPLLFLVAVFCHVRFAFLVVAHLLCVCVWFCLLPSFFCICVFAFFLPLYCMCVLPLLLLLFRRRYECVCMSTAPQSNWQDPVPSRLGVNSRRLRHHRPSSTHNCERSKARKNQLAQKFELRSSWKTQETRRKNVQISKCSSSS